MAIEEISNIWILILALILIAIVIGFFAVFKISIKGGILSSIYYTLKQIWLFKPIGS